jgi:alkylation response protein AidB-like acyl-CoA dehydrogenase
MDLVILLQEMGYYAVPGPYFSTVVQAGLTILEAGNEAQKTEILPGIADGKRFLSLAWLEEDGGYAPGGIKLEADLKKGQYTLSGTKLFVTDAHVADTLVCAARTGSSEDAITLFLVDANTPGLTVDLLDTMSGDKQCRVSFNQTQVPQENILGELDRGWPTLQKVLLKAAVAKSAEMSGGSEKVMDLVFPYAKGRKQFGRPIGAFQAIQHHCANMLTYADTIKFLVYGAAWKISEGLPFEMEAAICKAWTTDAYQKLVALGHQIVGGVGFMEEYDLQLYYKRAKTAGQFFGNADFHREVVAREMGL